MYVVLHTCNATMPCSKMAFLTQLFDALVSRLENQDPHGPGWQSGCDPLGCSEGARLTVRGTHYMSGTVLAPG